MKTIVQPFLKELLWIAGSFVLALFTCIGLLGWPGTDRFLDIHLHDTYIVIDYLTVLLFSFLVCTFLLYFFKERIHGFRRLLPGIILFIVAIAIILYLQQLKQVLVFLPDLFLAAQAIIAATLLLVIYLRSRNRSHRS